LDNLKVAGSFFVRVRRPIIKKEERLTPPPATPHSHERDEAALAMTREIPAQKIIEQA